MNRVVCAMSGGVDSAVAALLLKRRGIDVVGMFMKNWDLVDESGFCGIEEDRGVAQKVCDKLKIPFHEVNFVKEYWNNVFQHTIEEYQAGRTPNPDAQCNRYIKFKSFIDHVKKRFNIDLIATGHYARTQKNFMINFADDRLMTPNEFELLDPSNDSGHLYQALDQNKDQTFFLHKVSQEALKRTIFPIGGLYKTDVKSIARKNDLDFVANKKESMGICFIGLRNFKSFIDDYIPPHEGDFICLESGRTLGKHDGYFKYTIGQRARLSGMSVPYFVSHKHTGSGHIHVVPGLLHPALLSRTILTSRPKWIGRAPESFSEFGKLRCSFRFMHREPIIECDIFTYKTSLLVILDEPLRSLTPGQSAVFYSDGRCLGGADICHIGPSVYETDGQEMKLLDMREDAELWQGVYEELGSDILPRHSVLEERTYPDSDANESEILQSRS